MERVITPEFLFKPYPYQLFPFQAMANEVRRIIMVWPRRSGKDLTALNFTLIQALQRVGSYFYFLPTHKQAKKIIWDGFDDEGNKFLGYIPPELIKDKNESELQITLVNDSIIQLVGADTVDTSALGTNCIGAVFSEYSVQRPSGWEYVRPILAKNKGWAMFIYTPRGHNWGYDLFKTNEDNPLWACSKLVAKEIVGHNGERLIPQSMIDAEIRSGMPKETAEQEFNTSFSGIQQGSFFSDQCVEAENQERVGFFPYDPEYPAYTISDLGVGLKFATWFFQVLPGQVRWFDYHELESGAIPEFAKMVKEKKYTYEGHYAPFDIKMTDIGTGQTRIEAARKFGIHFRPIPKFKAVADRIDAARRIFPISTFNVKAITQGWRALLNYRREYDEIKREYSDQEVGDWASHGGSSFTYGAFAARKLGVTTNKGGQAVVSFDEFEDAPAQDYESDFDEFCDCD
jgi:phage terminase large subunit